MEIETLKKLALMGAGGEQIAISAASLARELSASPQTAARRLCSLEKSGYITRTTIRGGQKVKITDKGIVALLSEHRDYQRIFEKEPRKIRGRLVSGLGEGQYYISHDGYRSQFREVLGFDPYPGTMNLKLSQPFVLGQGESQKIRGFSDHSRTYGGCLCIAARVGEIECAVVRPERSAYPADLMELIAPVNLRETLRLSDGDVVEVVLR
ncbi:MAG: Riboflavin kinase [Methanosaeta sp. PtaB.Bin039]|nr:MAG: Riboflavin kinase [Methanosaeta sp. PtaB.Bin039]OPY44986.1 MAG: Riboflavin kinase [Methanosaeta sp. PtaU1.Bin028]HOT07867.1 DUF120 domain-containing protein [Methanotrichaceae archaeon]HQF17640.1 DUF120 domain-containing protein [Methanotrichaceae archaeon]HQI92228.1 DUF120 domain-containing protein [Methanotrichaceae archaeon]